MKQVEWNGVTYRVGEMTYGDTLRVAAAIRALPKEELCNDAAIYMHIQSAFVLHAPIEIEHVADGAQRVEPPRTREALLSAPTSLVSALGMAAVQANGSAFAVIWDFLLVARQALSAAATPSES